MKKILALLLALAMVFALAACGNTAPAAEKPAEQPAAEQPAEQTAEDDAEADAYYIELTYSNVFNPKEWNYKAAEKFAEMVTERTEGHVKVEFPDLNALVDFGKAHEGELIASTNGAQASNHIGAQAFANSAGFTYKAVPKGNTNEELTSLLGKEADFCVVKVPDIAAMADSVKVLAVFGTERLPELPDVPTLAELGFYQDWLGSSRCVAAPAGVSEEVIKFYEAAFKAAMEDPDYLAEASLLRHRLQGRCCDRRARQAAGVHRGPGYRLLVRLIPSSGFSGNPSALRIKANPK